MRKFLLVSFILVCAASCVRINEKVCYDDGTVFRDGVVRHGIFRQEFYGISRDKSDGTLTVTRPGGINIVIPRQ